MSETPPENAENKKEEKSEFKVNDRRHWAHEGELEDSEETDLEEQLPSYVERLKNEAEEKDRRLREYIAAFKAKTAEIDEVRGRLQRDNETKLDQFKARLFARLVPILDNLKRADAAAKNNGDFESLKQGIQMIVNQFARDLEENGVKPISAKGRKFDPVTDEACMTVETQDPEQDNIVLEELETGYMFRDKLIKPVKVKVAKLK
ncbi:MAG: nucleotide exchange factor GrpE [Nitrospinales bacterium]